MVILRTTLLSGLERNYFHVAFYISCFKVISANADFHKFTRSLISFIIPLSLVSWCHRSPVRTFSVSGMFIRPSMLRACLRFLVFVLSYVLFFRNIYIYIFKRVVVCDDAAKYWQKVKVFHLRLRRMTP